MPNLIIFDGKRTLARGLNKNSQVDENKLRNYLFDDDLEKLKLLEQISKISSANEKLVLFYPGCGSDILLPLLYMQKLFPEKKELSFIFVDEEDCLEMIKTVLDRIGISFLEKQEKILFYYNRCLVELKFIIENVFTMPLPKFDLYFEKSFRIIREQHKDHEQRIFEHLNSGGVIISDSGFRGLNLDYLIVPKELSSYGEMVIGIKS